MNEEECGKRWYRMEGEKEGHDLCIEPCIPSLISKRVFFCWCAYTYTYVEDIDLLSL